MALRYAVRFSLREVHLRVLLTLSTDGPLNDSSHG